MGKFDGYLLLSDMDGTLTFENKVSPENQAAIRYFQEEGGLFTIATGRPPQYIRHFADQFTPNTYVVAVNGTVLYDLAKDRLIWSDTLDDDTIEVIEYAAAHFPHMFSMHTTNSFGDYSVAFDPKGNIPFREFAKAMAKPWYKMIIIEQAEYSDKALQILNEKFGDRFAFDRSWPEGIEMHTLTSGKGACIKLLREMLPGIHTVVGAGDYENDITMLKEADIGYAMGNALPHVKAAADRVTVDFRENAIAHIIQDLEREL